MKICQNTAISKLQPGQILGADVMADNHVLLNEGTVLTEDIIWKLMAWKDICINARLQKETSLPAEQALF